MLRSPWLPAFLLAALVGSVFFLLRSAGPESVLRLFHVAAVNGDVRAMQRVSMEQQDPYALLAMQRQIAGIAQVGGRYEVRNVDRRVGYAIAEVAYRVPYTERAIPMLFIIERRGGRWYVDPERSAAHMSQVSAPPGSVP